MKAGGTPRLAAPAWTQGVPPASRAMLATPPAITVHTSPSIAAQDIPGGVSASRALHLHASARGPELAWGAGGHSCSYGTQPEALTTLPTPPPHPAPRPRPLREPGRSAALAPPSQMPRPRASTLPSPPPPAPAPISSEAAPQLRPRHRKVRTTARLVPPLSNTAPTPPVSHRASPRSAGAGLLTGAIFPCTRRRGLQPRHAPSGRIRRPPRLGRARRP